jgi:hypothetical protein
MGVRRGVSKAWDARRIVAVAAVWVASALLVPLLAPGVALAAGAVAPAESKAGSNAAVVSTRIGLAIGLAVVLGILVLGTIFRAHVSRLFIGQDNRVSTSKTVAAVWTMLVAAALFGFVYANLLNHPQALRNTGNIVGQYAVLFGGPLGSAILAKQIVTGQVSDNASSKPGGSPSAKDLIANDVGNTDLGDFQYVLFNAVAMFFVVSSMLHTPLNGLPHIPDVLLGLTSVSAVGYVGKKALTPTETVTASLDPNTVQGGAGSAVNIEINGLAASKHSLNALVQFGESPAGQLARSSNVTDGNAVISVNSPNIGAAANTAIAISVVTEEGAVLSAGNYTYQ